jgi:hypothetical protein
VNVCRGGISVLHARKTLTWKVLGLIDLQNVLRKALFGRVSVCEKRAAKNMQQQYESETLARVVKPGISLEREPF